MRYVRIIIPFIFLFFLQCSVQPTGSDTNDLQSKEKELGKVAFSLDMSNAPSDVRTMRGLLTRQGQDTIFFDFSIEDSIASALVENIPAGSWFLQVDAYNTEDVVIYTGRAKVNVQPGVVTPVFLHLNPTTGSLDIVVTWGYATDYAIVFDGIDDYLIVNEPDSLINSLTTQLTIEGWINVNSIKNIAPRIIDRSDNFKKAPNGDRFLLALGPENNLHLNINGYSVISKPIPTHKWIHVAGTYDGSYLKVYINGRLSATDTCSAVLDVTEAPIYIGNNALNNRPFDGSIANLRIWNIALPKGKINAIFHNDYKAYSRHIIAYWPMNEGRGKIAYDIAGDNNAVFATYSINGMDDLPYWVPWY